MRNVFVIGNGPSAMLQRLGARIDSADVVLRINDFQTKGYEEFVGSKTDILFTCRLNEYRLTIQQFKEVVLCLLMNPLNGVTIESSVLQSPNIVHAIDWPEVQELAKNLDLRAECYPSTGFMAILYTLRRFGHAYILGFDGLRSGNRHYYEEGDRAVPVRHDGERELLWLQQFERLGLITRLNNDSDFYSFDGHDPLISKIKIQ